MNLRGFANGGGVGVFSREVFSKVVIFLSKIRSTHTQLLPSHIFMYACNSDFAMLFCCALAYTITANCVKLCLPSFAVAQSVLFAHITACTMA